MTTGVALETPFGVGPLTIAGPLLLPGSLSVGGTLTLPVVVKMLVCTVVFGNV